MDKDDKQQSNNHQHSFGDDLVDMAGHFGLHLAGHAVGAYLSGGSTLVASATGALAGCLYPSTIGEPSGGSKPSGPSSVRSNQPANYPLDLGSERLNPGIGNTNLYCPRLLSDDELRRRVEISNPRDVEIRSPYNRRP